VYRGQREFRGFRVTPEFRVTRGSKAQQEFKVTPECRE
jgi:hypothetical protein